MFVPFQNYEKKWEKAVLGSEFLKSGMKTKNVENFRTWKK